MSRSVKITSVKTVLHDRRTDTLDVFGIEDGRLPMGVLVIATDEGIEGHCTLSYPGPGPAGHHELDHLDYGLVESFRIDGDGLLHVPDRPGLGVDIDWDLIDSAPAGVVE